MLGPSRVRMHPNLGDAYRRKVEELSAALRDPTIHDEALEIAPRLVDRLVVHLDGSGGREIEVVGDIVQMVTLGSGGAKREQAALDERRLVG